MEVKITFLSDWHCGSGLSAGADVDQRVIRDEDGLPYIPGKTVKGLIRHAARTLCDLKEGSEHTEWSEFITDCFGEEDTKLTGRFVQGKCRFSNAEVSAFVKDKLSESDTLRRSLFRRISSTAIDEKGQAKEHTLRKIEVTVPIPVFFSIQNLEEKHKAKIQQCLRFLRRIGTGRTRGLGRCTLEPVESEGRKGGVQ